jgi:hypothetical protein
MVGDKTDGGGIEEMCDESDGVCDDRYGSVFEAISEGFIMGKVNEMGDEGIEGLDDTVGDSTDDDEDLLDNESDSELDDIDELEEDVKFDDNDDDLDDDDDDDCVENNDDNDFCEFDNNACELHFTIGGSNEVCESNDDNDFCESDNEVHFTIRSEGACGSSDVDDDDSFLFKGGEGNEVIIGNF